MPQTSPSFTYDVFLNFRGEDTRLNFTGNLYNSLHQRGIHTFIDDQGLQRGEQITPALLKAIRESRIAILVFSKNYASSTFCLDELVQILGYLKAEGRLVLPIFYDVEPSQVRHQTGTYAEALAKHEERFQHDKDKVQTWRNALTDAANLSGWHFKHGSQPEFNFFREIISEVSKKIDRTPLHIAEYPTGLESPVVEVTSLLGLGSDDGVNMVGIYGTGGIGKTTIARAVYNLIGDQFEGLCFLSDIREKASNKHGLVQLQETLLAEILGEDVIKVGDVNKGIPIIKRRLHRKKVLLILDDVDKRQQIKAVAGGQNWFGSGSKVIITTRDKHLLATHGVVSLYEAKQLNDEKSMELFCWHAFHNEKAHPNYVDISKRAVSYACGLPLALEVIGSHLYGRSLDVWNSALDKYERIPHKDVHEILKVSYDGLEEDEKGIFLDVACFFNTYEVSYAKEMLYIRGFHAENGIQVLTDKSLIKIDGNDCIRMHDLVQNMGREIVRRESTTEPGRRSRLWHDDDIVHVLEETSGTDKIEVLVLRLCKDKKVQWSGEAFKEMKNLKILIIINARFSRGPEHLPNSLRVLEWSGYPSESLPPDFKPKKLEILSLHLSCLQSFTSLERFESLSFMDFEGCKCLTELPSLSGVPNLGALCLDNCRNLIRIHGSVGFLDKLVLLSARGCTELEMLAPCIKLSSLETLDLSGCSNLVCFPEVLGRMESIRDVYLDQTAICALPFSVGNLVGLQRLYLRECRRLIQLPSSIHILPKLEVITAYECRGFRLFELNRYEEKGSSQVSPFAMIFFDNQLCGWLNVYSWNINHDNFVELCVPSLDPFQHLESVCKSLEAGCRNWYVNKNKELSTSFWFQKKFPKIAVGFGGDPGLCIDCMVLDLKFSVFINGTKQFSSSSNYIYPKPGKRRHILWCNLRSRVERIFSEQEWNHVEISCVYKHHTCGPQMEMANQHELALETLDWSLIYVPAEGNSMENVRFEDPESHHLQSEDMKKYLFTERDKLFVLGYLSQPDQVKGDVEMLSKGMNALMEQNPGIK